RSDRAGQLESADRRSLKRRHHGTAAESLGQFAAQRTDVGAGAAANFELELGITIVEDRDLVNHDRPWLKLDRLAGSRQIVRSTAGDFDGGEGRRALQKRADHALGGA